MICERGERERGERVAICVICFSVVRVDDCANECGGSREREGTLMMNLHSWSRI